MSNTEKIVVKEYKLDEYVHIKLVHDPLQGLIYVVEEPEISEDERKVIDAVKEKILSTTKISLEDSEGFRDVVRKLIRKHYKKYVKTRKIPEERVDVLLYYIVRDIIGFGKLDPLLKDPNIEDIHVLGTSKPVLVWYTQYDLIPTNIAFETEDELQVHVQKVLFYSGKHISYTKPIVDGSLPQGFRVHVVHKSVSTSGTQVVIRKHRQVPFSVLDLIRMDVAPPEVFAYLWLLVDNKRSVLIIGETAAGKSTLLNAVASLIPYNMKIVVVEEVRELRLPHPNVSYLVTKESVDSIGKVTLFDLVKAAMRQRPDYIIVGEIRGEEAYALFQAMTLGHGGLGTMHADDPVSAVKRLMMKPLNIPPYMIKELDTIVHITKFKVRDITMRYVVTVADLVDIDEKTLEPRFSYVYRQVVTEGGIERKFDLDKSVVLRKLSEQKGMTIDYYKRDVDKRKRFLVNLAKGDISYDEFIRKVIEWGREVG
jgi:flagellar protein FlaI